MKHQLLALDVDGTLVGPDNVVPTDVAEAISAAGAAGLRVCLATGRTLEETLPVWRQLRLAAPHEPMVLVGGAMVSEPASGRTLYQKTISRELTAEYGEALLAAGYSAIAFVDPWRHGLEYIVADGADAAAVRDRWFSQMKVRIRRVAALGRDEREPMPMRINAVVDDSVGAEVEAEMLRRFGDRLNIHVIHAPNYGVTILEAFAPGASKWTALKYLAQAYEIGPGGIVAVGDDVNDVPMLRGAGLGVAMPNATPRAKDAADRVAEEGLVAFLRRLAAGECSPAIR